MILSFEFGTAVARSLEQASRRLFSHLATKLNIEISFYNDSNDRPQNGGHFFAFVKFIFSFFFPVSVKILIISLFYAEAKRVFAVDFYRTLVETRLCSTKNPRI